MTLDKMAGVVASHSYHMVVEEAHHLTGLVDIAGVQRVAGRNTAHAVVAAAGKVAGLDRIDLRIHQLIDIIMLN